MKYLLELSKGWFVNLSSVGDEWTLIITSRDHRASTHTYVGTDLERVINHAWAGAPDGRV